MNKSYYYFKLNSLYQGRRHLVVSLSPRERKKKELMRDRVCWEKEVNSPSMLIYFPKYYMLFQLPSWLSGKESAYQCRRLRFNPWVGKIPQRRKWQPISCLGNPGSLAWEIPWTEMPGGLPSMWSQESDTTGTLSTGTQYVLLRGPSTHFISAWNGFSPSSLPLTFQTL